MKQNSSKIAYNQGNVTDKDAEEGIDVKIDDSFEDDDDSISNRKILTPGEKNINPLKCDIEMNKESMQKLQDEKILKSINFKKSTN